MKPLNALSLAITASGCLSLGLFTPTAAAKDNQEYQAPVTVVAPVHLRNLALTFASVGREYTGKAPLELDLSSLFPALDSFVSMSVDYGDSDSGNTPGTDLSSHIYKNPGKYTVSVALTDRVGASHQVQLIVRVLPSSHECRLDESGSHQVVRQANFNNFYWDGVHIAISPDDTVIIDGRVFSVGNRPARHRGLLDTYSICLDSTDRYTAGK